MQGVKWGLADPSGRSVVGVLAGYGIQLFALAEEVVDVTLQFLQREGFAEDAGGTGGEGGIAFGGIAGEYENGDPGLECAQAGQGFDAAQAGHGEVQGDDIKGVGGALADGLCAVGGFVDFKATQGEPASECVSNAGFIVNDEEAWLAHEVPATVILTRRYVGTAPKGCEFCKGIYSTRRGVWQAG